MKQLLYKLKKWFYRNSPINVHHEMTTKLEEEDERTAKRYLEKKQQEVPQS